MLELTQHSFVAYTLPVGAENGAVSAASRRVRVSRSQCSVSVGHEGLWSL